MEDIPTRRADMVVALRERGVRDERVLAAMATVPREQFVTSDLNEHAYGHHPLPLPSGQTISEPWIVAAMAEALELTGTERVLEVGVGSGYAAAVLSRCAAEVIAVEIRVELARSAHQRLLALGYDNVQVRCADGHFGALDRAPFDAISVAAMAQDEIPPALIAQLATYGLLVVPVGQGRQGELVRYGRGRVERLMSVGFVPLVDDPADGR